MRLVVKRSDGQTREFSFAGGPVYIGRHAHSQVFLPERTVSRQHAVIYTTQQGTWVVEDLDSANKTSLNGQIVHKAQLKSGDIIQICNFTIEVDLETVVEAAKPVYLEDTLITPTREPQVIIKRLDSERAPDIRLPARRIRDFAQAAEAICEAGGLDEIISVLLRMVSKQFNAFHVWCGLRSEPTGPMTNYAGRCQDGRTLQLGEIKLADRITEAIEKNYCLLFPSVPLVTAQERLQSAMIAPVTAGAGCFGAIYLDNETGQERYTVSDLDFLMLLATHTASVVRNF